MNMFCVINNGFGRRAESKVKGLPLCSFDIWWRNGESNRQPDHYRVDVTPKDLMYKLTDNYDIAVNFSNDVNQFNLTTLKEAMINNVQGICGSERYYYVDDEGDEIPIDCDNELHEALKFAMKRRENGNPNVMLIVESTKKKQQSSEKDCTEVFYMKFAVDKPDGAIMLKGNLNEGLIKKVLDLIQKETSGMIEITNTSSFSESDRILASLKKYADEMKEQITADVTNNLMKKFERLLTPSDSKSGKCLEPLENQAKDISEQSTEVKNDSGSTETDNKPLSTSQSDDKIESKASSAGKSPTFKLCVDTEDKSTSTQSNFLSNFNFRPQSQEVATAFKTFRFSNDFQIDKNFSLPLSLNAPTADATKSNAEEVKEPEKSTKSTENPQPTLSSEKTTKDASDKEKGSPSDSEFEIISKDGLSSVSSTQFKPTATPPFLFTGNISSQNTTNATNSSKQPTRTSPGSYKNFITARRRTSHSKY